MDDTTPARKFRANGSRKRPHTKAGDPAPGGTRGRRSLPPGLLLIPLVAAFYVWTTTSSGYAFEWGTHQGDFYNSLADGFLAGHLYLPVAPLPALLALKNPYDPVANEL